MSELTENGFEIRRGVFTIDEIQHMKEEEADRVASMVGSPPVCATCATALKYSTIWPYPSDS